MTLDRTMIAFHLVKGAVQNTSGDSVFEVMDSLQVVVKAARKIADDLDDRRNYKSGGQYNNPNYPLMRAIQDDVGRMRKDFERASMWAVNEDEERVRSTMLSILKLFFCVESNLKKLDQAECKMSD